MSDPSPVERLERALPHLQASLGRSNPDSDTLGDIIEALVDPQADTRLWSNDGASAVTVYFQTMEVKLDEQVWQAGGKMADLMQVLEQGAEACRQHGMDRLVITNTRKGWARTLAPYGFRRVEVLVKDL